MDQENESPFSDEDLRLIAKEKILMSLALKIHALAFVGVNITLFVLNWLVTTFSAGWWFIYPLFGWNIGICLHAVFYYIYSRGITGANRIGLLMHASAYMLTTLALFMFNVASFSGYLWFLWPALFWPVGLIIHALAYKMTGGPGTDDGRSWLDRKADKEVDKSKPKATGQAKKEARQPPKKENGE